MTGSWRDLPLTFAALGATGAVFGPALPALAEQADISPARASLVVSALFAGLLLGVGALQLPRIASTPPQLLRRGGALLQAGALVALPVGSSLPALLLAGAVAGVGFGASEAAASAVVVIRRDGARRLSVLGAAFAATAILTPAAVALSLYTTGGLLPVLVGIAGLQVLAGLGAGDDRSLHTTSVAGDGPARTAWPLAAVLMLYVGAEVLLSTWATELTRMLLAVDASVAALASTAFWACLALGRLLGSQLAMHLAPARLLLWALPLAGIACGIGAGLAGQSWGEAALVVLAVAVVLLGPVYALALAVGSGGQGIPRPRVAAFRIGLGALGGAVVPAVVASFTDLSGVVGVPLTAALLLAAASCAGVRLNGPPGSDR